MQLPKPIVFPAHPRVKARLQEFGLLDDLGSKIKVIPPASYFEMIAWVAGAKVVLTDSGGLQKEARILEVPCVTLREETEWVETLKEGWNRLAGSDPVNILSAASEAAKMPISAPNSASQMYGGGMASIKIIEKLLNSTL